MIVQVIFEGVMLYTAFVWDSGDQQGRFSVAFYSTTNERGIISFDS
jgi:hypothetical protein